MAKSKNARLFDKYLTKMNILKREKAFSEISSALKSGKNTYMRLDRLESSNFDMVWIKRIEDCIYDLGEIIANPREVTKTVASIVPVELAKKTNAESVMHLASHTQYIKDITPEGDVVPNKILNIGAEEDIHTYENRFIATLVRRLVLFIQKRYEFVKKFAPLHDEEVLYFKNKSTVDGAEVMIETKIKVRSESSTKMADISNKYVDRILKIREYILYFYGSKFMKELKTERDVRNPIVMTNILRKNPKYHKCYELYRFIEKYDRLGVSYKVNEQVSNFSEAEMDEMNSVMLSNYLALKSFDKVVKNPLKDVTKQYKPRVLTSLDDEQFIYGDLLKGPIEFMRVDDGYIEYLKSLVKKDLPIHPTKREKEYYKDEFEQKAEVKEQVDQIEKLKKRKKKEQSEFDKRANAMVALREKEERERIEREKELARLEEEKRIEAVRQQLRDAAEADKPEEVVPEQPAEQEPPVVEEPVAEQDVPDITETVEEAPQEQPQEEAAPVEEEKVEEPAPEQEPQPEEAKAEELVVEEQPQPVEEPAPAEEAPIAEEQPVLVVEEVPVVEEAPAEESQPEPEAPVEEQLSDEVEYVNDPNATEIVEVVAEQPEEIAEAQPVEEPVPVIEEQPQEEPQPEPVIEEPAPVVEEAPVEEEKPIEPPKPKKKAKFVWITFVDKNGQKRKVPQRIFYEDEEEQPEKTHYEKRSVVSESDEQPAPAEESAPVVEEQPQEEAKVEEPVNEEPAPAEEEKVIEPVQEVEPEPVEEEVIPETEPEVQEEPAPVEEVPAEEPQIEEQPQEEPQPVEEEAPVEEEPQQEEIEQKPIEKPESAEVLEEKPEEIKEQKKENKPSRRERVKKEKAPKEEEKLEPIPGRFIVKTNQGYLVSKGQYSVYKHDAKVFIDFNEANKMKNTYGGKVVKL